MTNEQLIERIASLNAHQLHIESLESLLQSAIDHQARENRLESSAYRKRYESALKIQREIQTERLNAFRNDMKA